MTLFQGSDYLTVEQVAAAADDELWRIYHMGPKTIRAVREAVDKVAAAPPAAHEPRRGSDVEAWIKSHRETYRAAADPTAGAWHALDRLLDDYLAHAAAGIPLGQEVPDGSRNV